MFGGKLILLLAIGICVVKETNERKCTRITIRAGISNTGGKFSFKFCGKSDKVPGMSTGIKGITMKDLGRTLLYIGKNCLKNVANPPCLYLCIFEAMDWLTAAHKVKVQVLQSFKDFTYDQLANIPEPVAGIIKVLIGCVQTEGGKIDASLALCAGFKELANCAKNITSAISGGGLLG